MDSESKCSTTRTRASGIHIVSSGTGPNLHLIANIDYGFMVPDIIEEDEEPKKLNKKKRNHKSKGTWSLDVTDERANKFFHSPDESSDTSFENSDDDADSCIEVNAVIGRKMAETSKNGSSTTNGISVEKSDNPERESRSFSRTSTWKRRDSSWDKKWTEQVAKNEEDLPKSNALAKAIRAPGRLDNSLWEIRAASSEIQLKGLPPRTPQPSPMISRKNSDRQLHKRLFSQDKSHSRSLTASPSVDFITSITSPDAISEIKHHRPSLPKVQNGEKSKREETGSVPSIIVDPDTIDNPDSKKNATGKKLESEEKSSPSGTDNLFGVDEKEKSNTFTKDTKGPTLETCEPPSSIPGQLNWKEKMQAELVLAKTLLHGKENVDSVIRLLEQTYEKLMADEDKIKQVETTTPVIRQEVLRTVSQSPEWKRRSGTYEAVLVHVDDFENDPDQMQKSDGRFEKYSNDRREFFKTMVNESKTIDKQELIQNENFEKETEEKVSQVEFESDEDSPPPPPPLPPPRIDSKKHRQTNLQHLQMEKSTTEEIKSTSDEQISLVNQVDNSNHSVSSSFQSFLKSQIHETSSATENTSNDILIQTKESPFENPLNCDESSKLEDQNEVESFGVVETFPANEPKVKETPGPQHSLSGQQQQADSYNITHKGLHGQFYSFEVPHREKAFSITGMWSNVDVGLVKERSSFWRKAERRAVKDKSQFRQSRIIDPSGWVSDNSNVLESVPRLNESYKSKFISSGNLNLDVDREVTSSPVVVSSAMIVMEKRPNGRKSADIFIPSNYNQSEGSETISNEIPAGNNQPEKTDYEFKEIGTPLSQYSVDTSTNFDSDSVLGLNVEKLLQQEIQRKREIEEKLRQVEAENRKLLEREAKLTHFNEVTITTNNKLENLVKEEQAESELIASNFENGIKDLSYQFEEAVSHQEITQEKELNCETRRLPDNEVSPHPDGKRSPSMVTEKPLKQVQSSNGVKSDFSTPVRAPPKVPNWSRARNEEKIITGEKLENLVKEEIERINISTSNFENGINGESYQYNVTESHQEMFRMTVEESNRASPRFSDAEVNRVLVSPYLDGMRSPSMVTEKQVKQVQSPIEVKNDLSSTVRAPPRVPSRSSSRNLHVINPPNPADRLTGSPTSSRLLHSPSLETLSPAIANKIAKQAQELEEREKLAGKLQDLADRKLRDQMEQQEKVFHNKIAIERHYRLSDPDLPTYQELDSHLTSQERLALQRIRKEEMKEIMKLKEMEQRKRQIEEEIEKEKRHLAALQAIEAEKGKYCQNNPPPAVLQYEKMVRSKMGGPSPPPVPPPPIPPPPDPARLKFLMETLSGGPTIIEESSEADCSEIDSDKLSQTASDQKPEPLDKTESTTKEDLNKKSHNDEFFLRRYQKPTIQEIKSPSKEPGYSVGHPDIKSKKIIKEPESKPPIVNDPRDTVVEITSFTKAYKITREATEEDFIPDGVVKSAKDSLQRSFSKGSQKSFEKDEELKMLNPGTIKKVASAFDESANEKHQSIPPSQKIAQLFKAEYKKWPEYESDNEEDTDGYSEGADDLSSGLDLPPMPDFKKSEDSQSSGNVTPIPTQGELEEISTSSEPDLRTANLLQSEFRSQTPLKSLLKKQSGQDFLDPPVSVVESKGRDSPHKAVHFSDVDQIKLMSLESLASTGTSECSSNEPLAQLRLTGGGSSLPFRNQVTSYPPGGSQYPNVQLIELSKTT